MATKCGNVLSYHEKFPPINSHSPFIMFSIEVRQQIKNMSTIATAIV